MISVWCRRSCSSLNTNHFFFATCLPPVYHYPEGIICYTFSGQQCKILDAELTDEADTIVHKK